MLRIRHGTTVHLALGLLALVALLGVAGVMGDADSGGLADVSAFAMMCAVCSSPPPAEVQRFAAASRLTHRELQVARCAATGSTNREIARHLGISIRTVEGHLLRACEKLGIRGRLRVALRLWEVMEPLG